MADEVIENAAESVDAAEKVIGSDAKSVDAAEKVTDNAAKSDDAGKARKRKKAAETVTAESVKDETAYIYAGVSLPGIKSGTVIKGEIPKKLDVDFVRELVIPVEDYPAFKRKLAVTTSRAAYCWRKSAEYAKTMK